MLTKPGPATSRGVANVLQTVSSASSRSTNSVATSRGFFFRGLAMAMAALHWKSPKAFFVAGRSAAFEGSLYSGPKAAPNAEATAFSRTSRGSPAAAKARVRRGRLAAGATSARATPASIRTTIGRMDRRRARPALARSLLL